MFKLRTLFGLMAAISAMGAHAVESSWQKVASVALDHYLVGSNPGGRAALCSWTDENQNKTTIIIATKNGNRSHDIRKLVYTLDSNEPINTAGKIDLRGFVPRTILRTSSGMLYLTANSGTNIGWSEHIQPHSSEDFVKLISPKGLKGGIWVSINDGDSWTELTAVDGQGIMNAGYMACYSSMNTGSTVDDTAIRVGGAGICSTEIVCFKNQSDGEKYQKQCTSCRLQKIDSVHYVVISTVLDKLQKLKGDPLLTRIGELLIDKNGADLELSPIMFTYVVDSKGCRDHDKYYWPRVINIGFGTPIFNTCCTQPNIGTMKDRSAASVKHCKEYGRHTYHHGDTNECFPNGYWRYDFCDKHHNMTESSNSDDTGATKDKYHNCVVTYDNTGLIFTKLTPQNFNIINTYFGKLDNRSGLLSSCTDTFNDPQEVVAQYNGFMAIATNEKRIYIRKTSEDSNNSNFVETIFDEGNINRVMMTGVHPLDWHSTKKDKERYNGRLIAIGQSTDESIVKLYRLATQVFINSIMIDNAKVITYEIKGEPHARIKYWWQRIDKGDFTPLTRSGVKDNNDKSILDSGELQLDSNGFCKGIPYQPKRHGEYRLVASAVVGGFYCDCKYDDVQPDNIGVASNNSIVITANSIPAEAYVSSITNLKFRRGDNGVENDYIGAIRVDDGDKIHFQAILTTNAPNGGNLKWLKRSIGELQKPILSSGNLATDFKFDNDGTSALDEVVKVQFIQNGTIVVEQEFLIIVNPRLVLPDIIVDSYSHNTRFIKEPIVYHICANSILALRVATDDNVTWYKDSFRDVYQLFEKQATIGATYKALQLTSGPALNGNPGFTNGITQWLVDGWDVVSMKCEEGRNYNIVKALHGKDAQKLSGEDFIMIDSSRSYLYIAAAKNAEKDTQLTLVIECYNGDRKKINDIVLPEATLTSTWSSYGAVINNQDKQYPWPTGTAFVKLVIKLPKSKLDGAYLSAVRLMELPKETLMMLADYNNSLAQSSTTDLWSIAKQWDALVGCDASMYAEPYYNYYKVVVDRNARTVTSKEFKVKVWPKTFFTYYGANSYNGPLLLQLDQDPTNSIVVNIDENAVRPNLIINTSLDSTSKIITWEKTKELNEATQWVADTNQFRRNSYDIKLSGENEIFFVRCKVEIEDSSSPCNGLVEYSRVFKVIINVTKNQEL